jgi:hypothetical protein
MSKLKSLSLIVRLRTTPRLLLLCWLAFGLTGGAAAYGQAGFTLSASAFNPYAINQGQSTLSTVTISPVNGFSGTVSLVCAVTGGSGTAAPTCQVSPTSVTPPATASLTFAATGNASAGSYVVTVTGTGSAGSCSGSSSCTEQQSLNISVLTVAPSFNLTIQTPIVPSSVHAGSSASAVININPVNNYTGAVWLSCATISPLVTYPPVCSFTTPSGEAQPAQVSGGLTQMRLTIQAQGNAQTGRNLTPRKEFYALWLPLPMLAFVGIGAASSKRLRKVWALIGLFILAGLLILMPGCGNTPTGNTAPITAIVTPKNTYTFTLTGVDATGLISTNGGKGAATVTLTVD